MLKEGEAPALFTINVPSRWDHRAKKDCFIIKWDSSSWSTVVVSKAGRELLSGLAVRWGSIILSCRAQCVLVMLAFISDLVYCNNVYTFHIP